MDKVALKEFLQKKYENPEAFLENVIFPVFGEENYDDSGSYHWLRKHPEDQTAADNSGIQDILVLGSIYVEGSQLDIFDITVASKRQLANSRVGIQQLIRRIISTHSGAFMIFHYNTTERWDWRFTFCHKGASQLDSSDAKRYTFLLGPGQSCRTAAENFCKLGEKIATDGEFEMDDIIKAFDVEALSKEFFDKYKAQYVKFVEYMADEENGMRENFIDTDFDKEGLTDEEICSREEKPLRDYVKKLLGRIVFLHFIQKKGWLGVEPGKEWGEGDMDFMMNLFEKATNRQKDNFLDEVLEPIFEQALNTDRSDKDDLFDTGIKGLLNNGVLKIPYLNGGLFEREASDEPDSVFPAEYFQSLLTFLSQYNFTIDENDPNDAQVGIDPEMLGRIFENLLEDNKDKGAFYTPKEIVQYMCRESLIAYLQTDKADDEKQIIRDFVSSYDITPLSEELKQDIDSKLRSVKVCDPAIGSGAFPMGLLKEIFYCRGAIENFDEAAEIKKDIIQNNIYGVDIEKGAVDIARLRFWLSIIVDEKAPHCLPNMDFKIMQGNSLIEDYKGIDLSGLANGSGRKKKKGEDGTQLSFNFGTENVLENIRIQMDAYYKLSDHKKKNETREAINELVRTYIKKYTLDNPEIAEEIDALPIPNDQFFLWHTYFADVFLNNQGYDIVIGNPPYIKEYTNRKAFDGFREHSPYYLGKMDLWYGFACHGIDLLKDHGHLCFIAQNNWTTSSGAKKMRAKIVSDTKIIQMLDFNDYMVFGDSASVQTMVMLFEKDSLDDNYSIDYRKLQANSEKDDLIKLLSKQKVPRTYFLRPNFLRSSYADSYITFSENESIMQRIASQPCRLMEEELAQGIVPNPDVVNNRNKKHLKGVEYTVGEGVFVVEKEKFTNLPACEQAYIKPVFEPCDMAQYLLGRSSRDIIYITTKNWKNDAPTLVQHLSRFKGIMELRRENQLGRIHFYQLHWPREESFFENGPKILSVRKCSHPTFVYTEEAAYVMMAINVIKTQRWNLKFLTGILNSSIVEFWLSSKGKRQGENYQIDKEPLLDIPLPSPDCDQDAIIRLVDSILTLPENDERNPMVDFYRKSIDDNVFRLYGFSSEDARIILDSLKDE